MIYLFEYLCKFKPGDLLQDKGNVSHKVIHYRIDPKMFRLSDVNFCSDAVEEEYRIYRERKRAYI